MITAESKDFEEVNALPVEELFDMLGKPSIADCLMFLFIEYGRKRALEDYLTKIEHKYSLDKNEVMAILGCEKEDEEDE